MHDFLWWNVVGIVGAALGLAFISMIEAAMVSVSSVRIRQLIEQGHPTAALVEQLTGRAQQMLGGLVVAINLFVLLAANLTTTLAADLAWQRQWGEQATILWVNLTVLALLVTFCEITPKTISVHFSEQIALRTARIAYLINLLLDPIIAVLHAVSLGLLRALTALRILPGRITPAPAAFSEEDLKQLVTAGEQSGEVEATEREMIHGVIAFSEKTAREIMVPRTDLMALPVQAGIEDAIQAFMSSGHSRIPVYDENVDNIKGLLYVKDLLIRLHAAQKEGEGPLATTQLIRPAYFVPESKKSDELLREMQRRQVHMAVVVDEYGGTAGIITIEDLLEEIVGDIIDEYDKERLEVAVMPDGTAVVSGRASLEKIKETFDIHIAGTEAETVSGLVTEILGRIPEVGDRVTVSGVEFAVIEVARNRAERLRAVVLPTAPPEEPGEE